MTRLVPPRFQHVRRVRRRAIAALFLGMLLVIVPGISVEALRIHSGLAYLLGSVALMATFPVLEACLDALQSWRSGGHYEPSEAATSSGALELPEAPCASRFARWLSRLPGVRQLLAPKLELGADGLELRWRTGRRRIRWEAVRSAESRLTGIVLTLRSGEEVAIETCRLPPTFGPADAELEHAIRGAAFAALAYNDALAREINATASDRRGGAPYRVAACQSSRADATRGAQRISADPDPLEAPVASRRAVRA